MPVATKEHRPLVANRIDTLQAGRGIAAMAVVIHHAAIAAEAFGGPFAAYNLLYQGYLGVDFFFVLSGFIIYHTTIEGRRSLGQFAIARLQRVLLPYLPVGVSMGIFYTLLPEVSAGDRSWSWLPTLTLLPVQAETALSVAWTLKHEILFYGVFALFYFSGLLTLGLIIWTLTIVLMPFHAIPFALINLEFLFGILAAAAFRSGFESRWLFLPAGVALGIWIYTGQLHSASPLVGLSIALVLPVICGAERKKNVRIPIALVSFGNASYSLYLVHIIAIAVVARVVPGWLLILSLGVLASVVTGLLYHVSVERPLMKLRLNSYA